MARILLEIIYKTSSSKCINQKPAQINRALKPEEATLIKMLNEGADRSKILQTLPKLNWVILNRSVYNISGYFHPGGHYILEACNGR